MMASSGNATVSAADGSPAAVSVDNDKSQSRKTSPLNEDFEKLVHETLGKWHIQGVSVAVVDGDETWAEVIQRLQC